MSTHWKINTYEPRKVGEGDFTFNACRSEGGTSTETIKEITCSRCRELAAHPPSPIYAATLLALQFGERNFSNLACGACDMQLSWFEYWDDPAKRYRAIVRLLAHCAFEHVGGVAILATSTALALDDYAVNYANGKEPANNAEQNWRIEQGVA